MDTVILDNRTEDEVKLSLNGRIDAQNANEVASTIDGFLSGFEGQRLLVVCTRLKYISSAGLRIFLKLKKSYPDIRIVDVSNDVYDIFEMTGFTEILDVERSYRRISIEGCEKIGEGANGAVYRIDPETIVKVYKNNGSIDSIKHERDVAKRALILGIPTAISYDIVRVGEHYASVFELINAKSFSQIVATEPERMDECIDLSVSVLKQIHGTEVPYGELPDQKAFVLTWLDDVVDVIPKDMLDRIRGLIEAIPQSNHILHGDFHTKNLMLQDGEPIMIDMDTLCLGNPVFEFSPIFNAYRGYGELNKQRVTDFLGIDWEQAQYFMEELFKRYLGTDDENTLMDAERKAMVLGYLRIIRHAVRKENGNADHIKHALDRLSEILPLVNDLAF